VKKIKAALLSKLKVMENKIHYKPDFELLEQLLRDVMTEEAYDEAMSDYQDIIERRLEQKENENFTANQERF
jgi:hypothetical protein